MIKILEFISCNLSQLINSVGLIFDMIGAVLVSTEVVSQFAGNRFTHSVTSDLFGGIISVPAPKETDGYKIWEIKKYWRMKLGLFFLLLGFFFQIVSPWFN